MLATVLGHASARTKQAIQSRITTLHINMVGFESTACLVAVEPLMPVKIAFNSGAALE